MSLRDQFRGCGGRMRERGAAAAELVLVLPVLILLTLGTINLCVMLWTVSTLHFATEDAARWCSINAATCTTTTVNTHALGRYVGPAISPSFSLPPTAADCGEQVTGSATYHFSTGLVNVDLPISTTVCRPLS